MALNHPWVGTLVIAGPLVLHSVLLSKSFDLAVAEHRQPRQRGHQHGHAKAFVPLAKLIDSRALVRVAHEVDVALHDVRVEFQCVLDDRTILGVLFVAQHDHERAVVDAMHAQCANKIAFHHPEGLSQQQCARHLGGYAIHYLAPELVRHGPIELGPAHAVFGARGDGAAVSGSGKPEALHVAFGQGHGGIKANDGKKARHVQNGLDHLLTHRRIQVVELRRVVPGKAGAVVAVIDVASLATLPVAPLEDHGSIRLVEIMVLNFYFDAPVVGEIGAVKAIGRIGRLRPGDEPIRMLYHPGRVNAHVVGHHVAGQANSVPVGTVAQVHVSCLAAQIFGNRIVEERISRGHGIRVAAELLDGLRGAAPLPDSDQPKRVESAARELCQFLVWYLVKFGDAAAILPAHLRQPDVCALSYQHGSWHPGHVRRELLVFVSLVAENRHFGTGDDSLPFPSAALGCGVGRVELHPDGQLFLVQNLAGDKQQLLQAIA